MKVLISGCSGFVGKHVCELFLSAGHTVVSCGRNRYREELEHIPLDLGANIFKLPKDVKFDLFVHCAGLAHLDSEQEKPEKFFQVNLEGLKNICNCLQSATAIPDIVYISTVAVYGREHGLRIDESMSPNPTTPYGVSKLQAESFLTDWCDKIGVSCLIVRLPLVIGPDAPGNLGKMAEAIRSQRFFIFGEGSAARSWIDVRDIGRFILRVAPTDGTYNLTSGHDENIHQIAHLLADGLGARNPVSVPMVVGRMAAAVGQAGVSLGLKMPIDSTKFRKLTTSLTFSSQKARNAFDWDPQADFLSAFTGKLIRRVSR